jgi:putative ABC transport system ATP-binding protein
MEDASRHYQRGDEVVRALDGVSLEVAAGQSMALVGASGSGKSTLLNLVSAVDRPTSGRVEVCGIDLADASEDQMLRLRRGCIGLVFQAFHLVPHLTVTENVALPLALDGKRDDDRVAGLLDRVGLGHRRRHYPSELSGGEQQRTALARALVHRPRVLVADEPTGNLDSRTGEAVLALIEELQREEGAALLLATHDEQVATSMERIIHLHDGRITENSKFEIRNSKNDPAAIRDLDGD